MSTTPQSSYWAMGSGRPKGCRPARRAPAPPRVAKTSRAQGSVRRRFIGEPRAGSQEREDDHQFECHQGAARVGGGTVDRGNPAPLMTTDRHDAHLNRDLQVSVIAPGAGPEAVSLGRGHPLI